MTFLPILKILLVQVAGVSLMGVVGPKGSKGAIRILKATLRSCVKTFILALTVRTTLIYSYCAHRRGTNLTGSAPPPLLRLVRHMMGYP